MSASDGQLEHVWSRMPTGEPFFKFCLLCNIVRQASGSTDAIPCQPAGLALRQEQIIEVLAAEIASLVASRSAVTFAEVECYLRDVLPTAPLEGDAALEHPVLANVVFWQGSPELVRALASAIDRGKAHVHPCLWFVCVVDGGHPALPIARRDRSYARPHWAPSWLRDRPVAPAVAMPHQALAAKSSKKVRKR